MSWSCAVSSSFGSVACFYALIVGAFWLVGRIFAQKLAREVVPSWNFQFFDSERLTDSLSYFSFEKISRARPLLVQLQFRQQVLIGTGDTSVIKWLRARRAAVGQCFGGMGTHIGMEAGAGLEGSRTVISASGSDLVPLNASRLCRESELVAFVRRLSVRENSRHERKNLSSFAESPTHGRISSGVTVPRKCRTVTFHSRRALGCCCRLFEHAKQSNILSTSPSPQVEQRQICAGKRGYAFAPRPSVSMPSRQADQPAAISPVFSETEKDVSCPETPVASSMSHLGWFGYKPATTPFCRSLALTPCLSPHCRAMRLQFWRKATAPVPLFAIGVLGTQAPSGLRCTKGWTSLTTHCVSNLQNN